MVSSTFIVAPSLCETSRTIAAPPAEEPVIPPRKPVPPQPRVGSFVAPPSRAEALRAIQYEIGDCTRCALSRGRNKIVFGDGDPNARLMFVGEGPGADEDAQGLPFVGRAGQLLNNMIAATGLKREQVYIANIVKCRPPQNRVPEPDEANTCSPFLFQQIDVVRPEVIVALGSTAATYLLGVKSSLSGLRGRVHTCRGHQADRDLSPGLSAARSAAEERSMAGPEAGHGRAGIVRSSPLMSIFCDVVLPVRSTGPSPTSSRPRTIRQSAAASSCPFATKS